MAEDQPSDFADPGVGGGGGIRSSSKLEIAETEMRKALVNSRLLQCSVTY